MNTIGKRANWYRELADPKVVGTVLRPSRHPQAWALTGVGAAGAAAHTRPVRRAVGRHDAASDAAVGALAGQTAYQAAGYIPSHHARHKIGWNTRLSDITDPVERARHKTEDKARKASIRAHTDASGRVDWTGHYRGFPLEHRYARTFRAIAHTHRGRSGVLLGSTATVTGAALGARHGRREQVHKAGEYAVTSHTHPVRAAELAAGAAGVVWGVPRLSMLGPAIARGAKLAETHGGAEAARRTVLAAESARALLTGATKPLERVRRLRRVDHLVQTVPAPLRPAVATTAGAILAAHAIPVREKRLVPIEEH